MSGLTTNPNRYEEWVMPLIAEFFGIMFLVFIHCMGVYSLPYPFPAINEGFCVAVMIIIIGPVSGALINPAVTIAMALSGGLKWVKVPLYIVVQLIGATSGAALAKVACGSAVGWSAPGPGVGVEQAVLTEVLLTIFLVFTALQAGLDFESPIAAFAVGFVVVCDIMIGAKISSSCMNPSLAFGPAVLAGYWDGQWIFWVGPISGAIIAAGLHKLALASRKNRVTFRRRSNDFDEDSSTKRRDSDDTNQVSPV